MIRVHRLKGRVIFVNAELIETVEATPDTVLTLTSGRKLLVAETVEEVVERMVAYHRRVQPVVEGP